MKSKNMLVLGGTSGIGKEVAWLAESSGNYEHVISVGYNDFDVKRQLHVSGVFDYFHRHCAAAVTDLVYCVGRASLEMLKSDMHDVLDVFETNVIGYIYVLSEMAKRYSGGNIVSVISDASRTPMRGSISYCSSKAAMVMATKVAAREMGKGWRVNAVSPSVVDGTPMTDWIDATVPGFRGWTPERARDYEMSNSPIGRRATVNEVASVIMDVLNGPEFMTGSIIDITGGK